EDGAEDAARAAPRRPEVHEDRALAAGLDHLGFEVDHAGIGGGTHGLGEREKKTAKSVAGMGAAGGTSGPPLAIFPTSDVRARFAPPRPRPRLPPPPRHRLRGRARRAR